MENIDLSGYDIPANVLNAGAVEDVAKMQFQKDANGVSTMSGFDKGISYRFVNIQVVNEKLSDAANMEIFEDEESIEFTVDKKTKPVYAIKYLSPDRLKFSRNMDRVIGGAYFENYNRWKGGLDAPGLSLEKWDVVNMAMVKTFNSQGIFSVEQLASRPNDSIVGVFPAPFIEAYRKAIQHVSNHDSAAKSKEQVNKLLSVIEQNSSEIETLKAQAKANKVAKVRKPRAKSKAKNKLKKRGSPKTNEQTETSSES